MAPRRPRSAHGGFTLVEIAISAIVFTFLAGAAFQMFVKGSKASAKATWRAQITGKSRNALRQLREAVEATSYPSLVSLTRYEEITDDGGNSFRFNLQPPANSVAGAEVTTHVYEGAGTVPVVNFWQCYPRNETPTAPPIGPNGAAILNELFLEPSTQYPDRSDLRLRVTSGTIEPDMSIANQAVVETRTLLTEIEAIEIGVPNVGSMDNRVVTFRVRSRDPVDGYMRVVEETRATLNVEIAGP